MKVTTKIKNLKDHIIGYFSKEQLSLDDKFLDVINNISPYVRSLRGGLSTLIEDNSFTVYLRDNTKGITFVDLNANNPYSKTINIQIPSNNLGSGIVYLVLPKKTTMYNKIIVNLGTGPYDKTVEISANDEDHLLKITVDSSKNMSIIDLGAITKTYNLYQ